MRTSLAQKHTGRRIGAAIAVVITLTLPGLAASDPGGRELRERPVAEWMRGVPRGCRLISLELKGDKFTGLDTARQVDITCRYAISEEGRETATLLAGVDILHRQSIDVPRSGSSYLRLVVALTPQQAGRLKLAAALGAVRAHTAMEPPLQGTARPTEWDVHRIEDRTDAIERQLLEQDVPVSEMERPTLATAPANAASGRPGSLILIPVESEPKP